MGLPILFAEAELALHLVGAGWIRMKLETTNIKDISSQDATLESVGASRSEGSIALDQWRGLALVLVLISHGFFFTNHVAGAGRIGVNLFFFISGLLVFRSLASSKNKGWRMPLLFWWRRLRRLYPALLAYLLLMLTLMPFLQHIPTNLEHSDLGSFVREMPAALGYYTNYADDVPASMGHFWSLAVEVQFYMVAPALFLLGRGSRRRGLWVYGAVLAISMVYGLIDPIISKVFWRVRYEFQVAVWPMILGFFCEFSKDYWLTLSRSFAKKIYWSGMLILPLSLIVMVISPEAKLPVIAMGTFLLLPCFFAYLFGIPFPGTGGSELAWLGERTYSIYLLQQPLTIAQYLPSTFQPIGALLSTFLGSWWFTWFERPFLSGNREKQIKRTSRSSEEATVLRDNSPVLIEKIEGIVR
jgi:peptidoglycan/LPS O-acetylase OafA/YrhL